MGATMTPAVLLLVTVLSLSLSAIAGAVLAWAVTALAMPEDKIK